MGRLPALAIVLTALLLGCAGASPGADNPAAAERSSELVRQLGSDSFEDRERAMQELQDLGRVAETALREGAASPDTEVSRRCQELLALVTRSDLEVALDDFLADRNTKHLLKLPAWPRFSKVVGDSATSRALFVQMCCSEGPLLDLAEKNPKDVAPRFAERCQQLQQTLFQPFGNARGTVSMGEVAALLYIASDARVNVQPASLYQISSFLHQPEPREVLQKDQVSRKLLLHFIQRHASGPLVHQCMSWVQSFQLKEAIDWVVEVAQNKTQQPYVRANAVITVGRMGDRTFIAKIEPLLKETAQVTQITLNSTRMTTQLRDVTLAMLIVLSGQDVANYPFPYLKRLQPALRNNPTAFQFSPHYLGFSTDAERAAAFKQWEESRAKK